MGLARLGDTYSLEVFTCEASCVDWRRPTSFEASRNFELFYAMISADKILRLLDEREWQMLLPKLHAGDWRIYLAFLAAEN